MINSLCNDQEISKIIFSTQSRLWNNIEKLARDQDPTSKFSTIFKKVKSKSDLNSYVKAPKVAEYIGNFIERI